MLFSFEGWGFPVLVPVLPALFHLCLLLICLTLSPIICTICFFPQDFLCLLYFHETECREEVDIKMQTLGRRRVFNLGPISHLTRVWTSRRAQSAGVGPEMEQGKETSPEVITEREQGGWTSRECEEEAAGNVLNKKFSVKKVMTVKRLFVFWVLC